MNHDLDHILDECIRALMAGESLEGCLARYPQYADELRPLLATVNSLGQIHAPQASPGAIDSSREKMLAAYQAKTQLQPVSIAPFLRYTGQLQAALTSFLVTITGRKDINNMTPIARVAIVLVLVVALLLTTGGAALASAAYASTYALPGDVLYPVKTSVERVQLMLTLDQASRAFLENRFNQNRLDEVRAVLDDGRDVEVEFSGQLTEIGENYLVVGGFTILMDSNLYIDDQLDQLVVGMILEVEAAVQPDGSLVALVIEIEDDYVDDYDDIDDYDDLDGDLDDDYMDDDLDDDSDFDDDGGGDDDDGDYDDGGYDDDDGDDDDSYNDGDDDDSYNDGDDGDSDGDDDDGDSDGDDDEEDDEGDDGDDD